MRRTEGRWCAFAAALIAAATGAGMARAGPITVNSAITLSAEEFVFREQIVIDSASGDPSGAGRERDSVAAVSVLGYGVDEKLTVFAVLPYVHNELELTSGGQRQRRMASGIGDARLFGRRTLIRHNWTARMFRLSALLGIELPTGDDDESDGFGPLPPSVRTGSGSWDPFGGVIATYQTLDFQIDGQASYKANTQAGNFEFGDVARLDASVQYRVWPRQLRGGVPGFLYAVLETNLIHAGRSRTGGVENANSGGLTWLVAPGIQYVTRRWIVEAAAQLPAIQDLNGTALEKDFVVRAGFRVNF